MPKFDVRLAGHSTSWYVAHLEVEATSQEEAENKAKDEYTNDRVDWGDPDLIDSDIELDEAEAEAAG